MTYDDDAAELLHLWAPARKPLEHVLGGPITDDDWCFVVVDAGGQVRHDTGLREEFIEAAREVVERLRGWRALKAASARQTRTYAPTSRDERYDGLSEVLAVEAASDPGVIRWRGDHLPDRLLSEHEVRDFLTALWWERPDVVPAIVLVPGSHRARHKPVEGQYVQDVQRSITYRVDGGLTGMSDVPANSPLGELADLRSRLANSYQWEPVDAVMFVLTGEVPRVHPILVTWATRGRAATARITLSIHPQTPKSAVAEAYANARKDPLMGGISESRRLDSRASALAAFLAHHREQSWPSRGKDWNQRYPDWQYTSARAFATDAKRAWKRVTGEDFAPTTWDPRVADMQTTARPQVLGAGVIPPPRDFEP
jgi:hypothetical protein